MWHLVWDSWHKTQDNPKLKCRCLNSNHYNRNVTKLNLRRPTMYTKNSNNDISKPYFPYQLIPDSGQYKNGRLNFKLLYKNCFKYMSKCTLTFAGTLGLYFLQRAVSAAIAYMYSMNGLSQSRVHSLPSSNAARISHKTLRIILWNFFHIFALYTCLSSINSAYPEIKLEYLSLAWYKENCMHFISKSYNQITHP